MRTLGVSCSELDTRSHALQDVSACSSQQLPVASISEIWDRQVPSISDITNRCLFTFSHPLHKLSLLRQVFLRDRIANTSCMLPLRNFCHQIRAPTRVIHLYLKQCRPELVSRMVSGKRKAIDPLNGAQPKKPKPDFSDRSRYKDSSEEIKYGIVLRDFYPPELINERAKQYATGEIERPIETLEKAIAETQGQRDAIKVTDAVVHWFKCDTRTRDNIGLHLASEKAKSKGVPLVCVYFVSPQDFQAHLTSAVRVDFILRNLQVLKEDLAELDIPLYVETIEKRKKVPERLISLCKEWGASHIFCNMEYEVDELRREAGLTSDCLDQDISFNSVHDTCVVRPGELKSGAGGQISIYSPWHRKWCAHLNQRPKQLDEFPRPSKNPSSTRNRFGSLFASSIPEAPASKQLSAEDKTKFANMWPAGEHEAHARLQKFISQRVTKYHETRNQPGGNGSSVLSPHLSAGTIAARTCVREVGNAAPRKTITDDRKQGHSMWIGEIAWRDFYKHVLCNWPYVW